jgi:hypothetical protein
LKCHDTDIRFYRDWVLKSKFLTEDTVSQQFHFISVLSFLKIRKLSQKKYTYIVVCVCACVRARARMRRSYLYYVYEYAIISLTSIN